MIAQPAEMKFLKSLLAVKIVAQPTQMKFLKSLLAAKIV
jgi:hypothetical protein